MLMSQLQNQLKSKNPQMFKQFQSLVNSKGDPQDILNKMVGGYSPEQMQQFRKFANGFGVSDEDLDKYGIKVK